MLIDYRDYFPPILSEIISLSFLYGKFSNCLKLVIVTPVHKSDDSTLVSNYKLLSLLPPISKLFMKCIYYVNFTNYLSKRSILSDTQY